jgi:hypothetical protein
LDWTSPSAAGDGDAEPTHPFNPRNAGGAHPGCARPQFERLALTRGLVKIRGAIDSEPFTGALMAQGDGTHRLPVKSSLRKAIGKESGDTVRVRINERIG